MSERRAEFLLALTTVFWSGTFVFTKFALDNCDPILFVTLRFALATLIALALWWRYIPSMSGSTMREGCILGALFGAGFVLLTWGLQFTTVSKSAFITGMIVIFIPGANWLVQRKRAEIIHLISVAVATIGLLLLTHPEFGNINNGDALTLCSSILWSFYISYLDKISRRSQHLEFYSHQLVVVQFLTTTILGVVIMIAAGLFAGDLKTENAVGVYRIDWTVMVIVALLYTAIFGSLVSTYLQTKYQRYVAPVKAGIIFSLEPIFASVIAYYTNHERLNTQELCGAGLMIVAIIFSDTAKMFFKRLTN